MPMNSQGVKMDEQQIERSKGREITNREEGRSESEMKNEKKSALLSSRHIDFFFKNSNTKQALKSQLSLFSLCSLSLEQSLLRNSLFCISPSKHRALFLPSQLASSINQLEAGRNVSRPQ